MKRALFMTTALLAWSTTGVFAQDEQQGGYHSVTCIKVRDGKMGEYRKFLDENRKVGQAAADSGLMMTGYRLRSIMPAGVAATCDFVFVSAYKATPPAPAGADGLAALLQKAGISMSAEEYRARREAVTRLVSTELWRTALSVGELQKGDFVFLNHMKVHDMANWMELERSIWKPMAETWVKEGSMRGWLVARPVLPDGTGLPYQAITVDMMPSWDAAVSPRPVEKTFKQVHSDKDFNQVFEKLGKSRDLALRELMVVEDKLV